MGLLAGALSFLGFFAFLVWFKFFGLGLETSYLFRVLTKFFVGGCFLWFFRSFTAVSALFFVFFVGDFLSFLFVGGLFFVFCFLTAGVWSVALYLQYLNFFGFLQFFAFFVLP